MDVTDIPEIRSKLSVDELENLTRSIQNDVQYLEKSIPSLTANIVRLSRDDNDHGETVQRVVQQKWKKKERLEKHKKLLPRLRWTLELKETGMYVPFEHWVPGLLKGDLSG